MTEREKMLAGGWFDPRDAELTAIRDNATRLMHRLNVELSNCGAELNEEQEICLKCGVRVKNSNTKNTDPNAKSKMAAGLLGIFLGQWGVHNFYLGYTGKAVAQLLLSIFGYILLFVVVGFFMVAAAGIWGLIEGIMILSGSINTDANGNPLRD